MQEYLMSCNTLQDALSSELILHAHDLTTLKQLLLNGADINYQSKDGWCLLFELISLGLKEHIVALTHFSLDLTIRDGKKRNALFWAIYHKNVQMVETLLNLGYSPVLYVTDELPALHYAIYKNSSAIVNILLHYKFDIECQDLYENTALSYAHLYGREEMVQLLEARGARNVNLDH
jgi:ankyrin repeat protein